MRINSSLLLINGSTVAISIGLLSLRINAWISSALNATRRSLQYLTASANIFSSTSSVSCDGVGTPGFTISSPNAAASCCQRAFSSSGDTFSLFLRVFFHAFSRSAQVASTPARAKICIRRLEKSFKSDSLYPLISNCPCERCSIS